MNSSPRRPLSRFLNLALTASLPILLAVSSSCRSVTESRSSPSGTEYLQNLPAPIAAPAPTAPTAPTPSPPATSPATAESNAWPASAPAIVARSAIAIDALTGEVLYEKNPDTRRAVASTQKLLTALIIAESGGLDRRVTVAESDTLVEPHKIGIAAGETYTRRQLLEALLVRSGNDIAHCLARTHAGSVPAFARLMNERARSLGMYSSNFVNASGLTEEGQYSSARDLTIVARAALRNPLLASITRQRTASFRFPDGRVKQLENTNKLLERSPYCHGMKTGYTRASGRCLVSCGTRNGRTVIVVILRSGWDEVWTDSRRILHWSLGA